MVTSLFSLLVWFSIWLKRLQITQASLDIMTCNPWSLLVLVTHFLYLKMGAFSPHLASGNIFSTNFDSSSLWSYLFLTPFDLLIYFPFWYSLIFPINFLQSAILMNLFPSWIPLFILVHQFKNLRTMVSNTNQNWYTVSVIVYFS